MAQRWGEFYTPEWLADYVVRSIWLPKQRWLDPTAGAGAFALAIARQCARAGDSFPEFVAFERDPWSLLSAAAAIGFGRRWLEKPAMNRFKSEWLISSARSHSFMIVARLSAWSEILHGFSGMSLKHKSERRCLSYGENMDSKWKRGWQAFWGEVSETSHF